MSRADLARGISRIIRYAARVNTDGWRKHRVGFLSSLRCMSLFSHPISFECGIKAMMMSGGTTGTTKIGE